VEKLQYDARTLHQLKKTYNLCTKSEFSAKAKAARQKIALTKNEWTYREMPDEVAQILPDVAEE
jgi:hypothetical protein